MVGAAFAVPARMEHLYHHRAWSLRGTLLVRDPVEAAALFCRFTATFPELVALIVMPDHVHLVLPHADETGRIARAEAAFARWRNHRRGERGPVWSPHPPVEEVPRARHPRLIRYVFLNANRKGLVDDPLAWPWSTYRERLGLAWPLVGPLQRDPERFHRIVSSDETAQIGGTPLPMRVHRPVTWPEVVDAALAVTRAEDVTRRGAVRTLAIQAAWVLGLRDLGLMARATGLSRSQIYHHVTKLPAADAISEATPLGSVIRLVGDPRFRSWDSFAETSGWRRYAGMR